jgi:DNA-binding GntR family transcriptional regulator
LSSIFGPSHALEDGERVSTQLRLSGAEDFSRVSTVNKLAQVLRDAILSGELAQGTQLRETALASQFGVGRSVLREALRELVAEELAVHKVNRGMFVTIIRSEDILDIYLVREVLEVAAVTIMIGRRAEDVNFTPIETAVAEMRRVTRGRKKLTDDQVRHAFRLDLRIHQMIVELSESPRLVRLYRSLSAEMSIYFSNVRVFRSEYLEQHEELLEALRRMDESSIEAVKAHLHRPTAELGLER